MSLVRQALAKAEREAAARTAREKGLPENLSAAGQPWRAPRRRSPATTGAVLALALAAAAGAGYWLSRPAARPALVPAAPPSAAAPLAPASTVPAPAIPPVPPAVVPDAAARPQATLPARTAKPAAAPVEAGLAVRELPLADGRKLGLGGIAWSEVAPLAYLNGRLVGVGESVEGYRVARIERDRVHLEKEGRAVVLLLRTAP